MKLLNFGWLCGKDTGAEEPADPARRMLLTGAVAFAAAGTVVVAGATKAQAWHYGKPHHYHSKNDSWEASQRRRHDYDDEEYHTRKRSEYRRRKYYHRKYGSWDQHPQCLHLGPFGVCEY
jgi:hypothetical protein